MLNDSPHLSPGHRIGFVSTRFSQTDGVSLETVKWSHVLGHLGHQRFYFAGLCDRPEDISYIVPEAHFDHPEILSIYEQAYTKPARTPELTARIQKIAQFLKQHLYNYVEKFDIELLIVENALSIPMNVPLGVALTEFIAETNIPTIGHHHDFYWERNRYLVNSVWDYLHMAFPPNLPAMRHVVINSQAGYQLSLRAGVSSSLIPNVMDFDNPPPPPDDYTSNLRADLGLSPDEYFFLQPTRIVRRKGIEHSIELVKRLGVKARLVISHSSGDEGDAYAKHIRSFAELLDVPVTFGSELVDLRRHLTDDGRKVYSLEDIYPFADLVTYPSLLEGFGNAFLEAVYFRRPILVNNYTIYAIDIKPKGFEAIEFDGFITDDTLAQVHRVLETPSIVDEMAEHNYQMAKRFYSYTTLERQLHTLLRSCFGEED